jgi:hypothetical protein
MAYLYENPNRHAPVRANGKRFWGYPGRTSAVRLIGVHTAESLPDFTPPDTGAENVARYLSTTDRTASYHLIVDSDSHVVCLPDEATAFGARGYNANTWHISFATQAHRWGTGKPDWWTLAVLNRAAEQAALRAKKWGIPIQRITKAQADAGQKGFIDHGRLDPGRRSDPGANFPWTQFLDMVTQYGQPFVPPPEPEPTPEPPPEPEPKDDYTMPNDVVEIGEDVYIILYATLQRVKAAPDQREFYKNVAASSANKQFNGPYKDRWDRKRLSAFRPQTPGDE